MKNWQYVLFAVAIAFFGLGIKLAMAGVAQTDNLGTPVPAQNGTSTLLNVTARMQQYVGFFGEMVMVVRLNATNTTGTPTYQLYNQTVSSGKLYFFKSGATPTGAFVAALNNTQTDGNFSLTGYYVTGNHFTSNGTICGVTSVDHLNTTDNYGVGIFRDTGATPNYFLCVDMTRKSSSYGFGNVNFEAIVPKTSSYQAYDIWADLE